MLKRRTMLDNHYRNNYGGRLHKPRNEAALYAIGCSEIAKAILMNKGITPESAEIYETSIQKKYLDTKQPQT